MQRFLLIAFSLLIVAAAGYVVWRNVKARGGASIAATGGKEMSVHLADTGRIYSVRFIAKKS